MHSYFRTALFAAIAIVSIQVGVGAAVYFLLPDWQTRGQFGDVFGAVNALFSGLAFAGLIYAILLQREDLALQRTELQLTRQELKRSASAQEQSELALRAQAEAAERSASLAAINFLLGHYKHELAEMRKIAYARNDPRLPRVEEIQRRETVLLSKLDLMFQDISTE
jgi:uncharacterized membrane protein YciS (DUF1049 family)